MKYRIGDMAELLDISSDLIRYYEKCGAVSPERMENNNYRTYSTLDFFMLEEILNYKQWDIGVREIGEMLKDDYSNRLISYLSEYRRKLDQEMDYSVMKRHRADEKIWLEENSRMNIGNFFVRKISASYRYHFFNAKNDDYGAVFMADETRKMIFDGRNIVFMDPYIIFSETEDGEDEWFFSIEKSYADGLHISDSEDRILTPAECCLCTVIDMGEIGEFSGVCTHSAVEYAGEHGYRITGKTGGRLISRGRDGGRFHRLMEIEVPVQER